MAKITGNESRQELPEKVLKLYQAVIELIGEGADIANMKVSEITDRAGIGKGTAYDYFDSKEEIIVYALLFFMEDSLASLENKIWEQKDFEARVIFILDTVDRKAGKGICMMRFINLLFESSQTGELLRATLKGRSKRGQCQPLLIGKRIVEKGIADGEIRQDMPMSYLLYTLVMKFITYHAFVVNGQNLEIATRGQETEGFSEENKVSCAEFRKCILNGIMEEFRAR